MSAARGAQRESVAWSLPVVAIGLAGVALLAFGVRAIGLEWIFVANDQVVLPLGDAVYHARITLWDWANFPQVLRFDPYLSFPGGAAVPWPPAFDWVLAGVAHAVGGGRPTVERVLAWSGPVLGALTTLGVYAAARQIGGRAFSLGCAAILALLPMSVDAGEVGNSDHHAAVAFVGALLLATCLAALSPARGSRGLWLLGAALALGRAAMLLLWGGSLLYLAAVEASLLLGYVGTGRRGLLRVEALSALAAAALVAPVACTGPTPMGGLYSAVALSRLHLVVLVCAAGVPLAMDLLAQLRPSSRLSGRLVHGLLAGALAAAIVGLVPATREGLALGLRFMTMQDQFGAITIEQFPLFPLLGRRPLLPAELFWARFAYVIPLAPVAALLAARDPARRPQALTLAGWTGVLGLLTLFQMRHGNEFAAGASIAFGLLLQHTGVFVAQRIFRLPRLADAMAIVLAAFLIWPAVTGRYLPGARQSLAVLRARPGQGDRALASVQGSLQRFLESVRELLPPESGFLEQGAAPAYGLLAPGNVGHSVRWVTERPTTLDGFWGQTGQENFEAAERLLASKSEDEAVELAARLRSPFVMTAAAPDLTDGTLLGRLHLSDGRHTSAAPSLAHFRLVTEGPAGGRPLTELFGLQGATGAVPYKLYEIVPGALLELRAEPGAPVVAGVTIRTPVGRLFRYEARALTGADGVARLRVPYATDSRLPARPTGDFVVRAGNSERRVPVSEEDVRAGHTIQVR